MAAYGLLTIYNLSASIGISNTSGTWTYAPLGNGIDNITEALNEVVQQYFFIDDKGFAKNHATGMAPTFTLTGRRVIGDAAQDYIFGQKYGLDTARQSSFQLTYTQGGVVSTITCDCTLANIQEWSGASTDDSAISFEVRFDGQPVSSNVAPLPQLTVVSVAGTTSGKTAVYVNPAALSGDTYEYQTGTTITLPQLGADPGEGWATWNGTDEIAATTGNVIGIVEVSSSGEAVKGGTAIVTAMA